MGRRVVVGLSGGVDSSVAAALLKEQGYEVIGVNLKLWRWSCPPTESVDSDSTIDAAYVCERLGIPFYVIDVTELFKQTVVNYFIQEYMRGMTPNPCVICNKLIKFAALTEFAKQINAEFVATGHYAQVAFDAQRGRRLLLKGKDHSVDQSYFLFSLSQQQLAHLIFPLGALTKKQVREIASKIGLKTAEKQKSVEICFLSGRDYREFLRSYAKVEDKAGLIVDMDGNVLGIHTGVFNFTIGQRRGLRIAASFPLYVISIDPVHQKVVVGPDHATYSSTFWVKDVNWIAIDGIEEGLALTVKIRYNHEGTSAIIEPDPYNSTLIRVRLNQPQRAITPGQAAVFYKDEIVVGGGWIVKSG